MTLFVSLPAHAATVIKLCDDTDPTFREQFGNLCATGADDIGTVIRTVIIILLIASVVIALFFLIWGGIKWILSGGDKTAVEGARNHIIAAIIGLVIAFGAFFILSLITQIFLGKSVFDFTLPTL